MNKIIFNILLLIVLGGFAFLVVSKKRKENKKQRETWQEFSEKNNYKYNPYSISGNYKGLSFTIERYDHQSYTSVSALGVALDKDKGTVYSIIKFNIPNLPKGLQIYLQEQLTNSDLIPITTQTNHPISTGDEEFDKAIVVRGENDNEVKKYFNSPRKEILLKNLPLQRDCSIQPYGIHLTLPSRLDSLDELEKIHKQLGDFAVELNNKK